MVRRMVGEDGTGKDGTGKGRRTSKGIRMNKTVSKSYLSMLYSQCHLFAKIFLPSERKPLLTALGFFNLSLKHWGGGFHPFP